nr:MAG TPA: hypothetical protein [Caudoviricetes sp.]
MEATSLKMFIYYIGVLFETIAPFTMRFPV